MLLLPEIIVLPVAWAVCLRWVVSAAVPLAVSVVAWAASVEVSAAVLPGVIVLPVVWAASVAVLAAVWAVLAAALRPLVMRVPERFSRKMLLPIRIPNRVQLQRKNPHPR